MARTEGTLSRPHLSLLRVRLVLAGFLVSRVSLAFAGVGTEAADPPGRIARMSDVEGLVSLQPAGVQDWATAALNRPLTTGDRLWSDQRSRAELDIGAAVVRLGSVTGLAFLNLDDRAAQMQLSAGTLIVRVRDMQPGDFYEVDTPVVAICLQQPGEYRAEVNERGDVTVIKVSQGAALTMDATGQQVMVSAQQQLTVSGTTEPAYDSAGLGPPDGLDNWSAARERLLEDAASAQYVANDIPGTQDLDDNGQWQETPENGYVWIPSAVTPGWIPYRYGHWTWISPWGWTWVDDAPWGFAPFHYGRWAQCNGRWCWVPGPRGVRPVYAPATVAWVRGAALGVSGYGSNVGWFPLGPQEAYVPAGSVSNDYVRNINTTNTTRLNNTYIIGVYQNRITPTHYANNRAAAMTAVPQSIFTSGQASGTHAAALSAGVLADLLVTAKAPAITPIRQSVLGAAEGHGVVKPPGRANRLVVARTAPPAAPANFEEQVAGGRTDGDRALGTAQPAQLPRAAALARVRLATPKGVAVPAGGLPHRVPPVQASSLSQPTLAERERALQVSRWPPSRQPSRPPSIPVYHPPVAGEGYAPMPESARTEQSPPPKSPPGPAPQTARSQAYARLPVSAPSHTQPSLHVSPSSHASSSPSHGQPAGQSRDSSSRATGGGTRTMTR